MNKMLQAIGIARKYYNKKTFYHALDVAILTKDKEQSYVDYCIEIKNSISLFSGQLAYWVKLADMKDHLSKTETLTDKLKAKYLEGLAYLL